MEAPPLPPPPTLSLPWTYEEAVVIKQEEEEEDEGEEGDGGRVNTEGKRPQNRGKSSAAPTPAAGRKRSVLNIVGKRRGGAKLALKTGMVAKKHKAEDEGEPREGDAWAKYMAEVKKYKAHQCSDDDKTRPLVK
uniref:Telomerase RNA component interacting RNase n=1 Tax=Callorhinchus milii TaxID=7868 RepID=V9LE36_CALMI